MNLFDSLRVRGISCALVALFGVQTALATAPQMAGVNLSGGDFGTSPISQLPGTLGTHYFYPSANHIDWAKSQGLELVRVPFRWERVHYDVNGVLESSLHAADIAALDSVLDQCEARGLRVILDMHNYAGRVLTIGGTKAVYGIGSPQLGIADYANTWRLLATHFKDRACIWGYDLMNEPVGTFASDASNLTAMYQAAVNAIREVDTTHAVILEGQSYAKANTWLTTGAFLLSVNDPANNVVFSAHCYFDRDLSGTYSHGGSVSAELVPSVDPDLASALNVGERRVKPFVDWCVANNVRGLVGEFGIPHSIDTANWNEVLTRFQNYIRNQGAGMVSATQWGGGAWGTSYTLAMEVRKDNSEPPMMPVVRSANPGPGTNFWFPFTIYANSLVSTADYSFVYPFASASPAATCTIDAADAATYFGSVSSSARSIRLSYTIPAGGYAGAGLHIRGPLSAGAVGGIAIDKSLAAGHVLSFYAKGTPGANLQVTLGSTLNASGIDSGSDTGTGTWISLNSISPLSDTWQRYEIPLQNLLSASMTGTSPIQRVRFNCYPADGNAYVVNLDQITLAAPSTNSAPTVMLDTSTGATNFLVGQSVTLIAQATDPNPDDAIDFVEFYANHETKLGIAAVAPYEWTTTFDTAGTQVVTASAIDSHGVVKQSDPKTLVIAAAPPTEPPAAPPASLTATASNGQVQLLWSSVSNTDHYIVKRGTAAGGPFATIATPLVTNFKDVTVINGTTYYYTVSAANALGQSANSVVVSALPLAPPAAPASLSANAAYQRISLSWSSTAFAASYTVKRSATSGGPYTVLGTVATPAFNDTTVANGTTYFYVVSAANSSGESPNSAQLAIAPQAGTPIIKDNSDTTGIAKTGTWTASTFNSGYYGTNYIHDGNTGGTGGKKVVFTPTIPATGSYDVYVRWVSNSGRASNAPIDINYAGGKDTFSVNQLVNGSAWILFGTYTFNAGTTGNVTVRNDGANGFVIADAVMFAAAPPSVTFTWSDLHQTYDGTPKLATVATAPANLPVSITYNGSATPPTTAGTYAVHATVSSGGYTGSAATTLVIEPALATVTLSNLEQTYDGTAKSALATTSPSGLACQLTYDGAPDAPIAGGEYAVTATILDANYTGAAHGVLHIAAASQTIDFPALPLLHYGDMPLLLGATASSGLPVSFEVVSGPATIGNGVLSVAGAGTVTIRATQEGDHNYAAAFAIERTVEVAKASQTISFATVAPKTFGDAAVVLSAAATSGLPVDFQLLSGPATLSGATLTFTGAGSIRVLATQAGNSNYLPALAVEQTISVAPASAAITLAGLDQIYDGVPKSVTATTTPAGLAAQITYNGFVTPPVAPGSYAVVARIDSPNYVGSVTDTLIISTTVLVRHAPTLNGSVEGSVQLASAEALTLNGSARVTGDLLVPGLPSVRLNGSPVYQGTLDGTGDASPTGYAIALNGDAQLRHVVRRTNAVAFPSVAAPREPVGTRDVVLNSPSQSAGDFATLRNLTVNGNAGQIVLPAGAYGALVANGNSGFTLGIAGTTEPAVYDLQSLTLNGVSELRIVGPAIVTLANGIVLNAAVGTPEHPEWLTLRFAQGGLTLNANSRVSATIIAPNGTVTFNGSSTLHGQVISDRLVVNGNGVLLQ